MLRLATNGGDTSKHSPGTSTDKHSPGTNHRQGSSWQPNPLLCQPDMLLHGEKVWNTSEFLYEHNRPLLMK